MLTIDAIELGINLIHNGTKHVDYDETVKLAAKYLTLSTGKDIESLLQRFVKREDPDMFKQRVEITKSITPAVCESLESPWNKVIRNERIKKSLEVKNKANIDKVTAMIEGFFGSDRNNKKAKGLEYWMKTRLFELTFADPNSWIAIEWDSAGPEEVIKPRPFEIPAANALNFSIVNDETKWLFCYQDIKIRTSIKAEVRPIDGKRYTLYDTDVTIVFEQFDRRFWSNNGNPDLLPNQSIEKIGSLWFIVSVFEPNIGFAPVFRIGYKRDRATNSRTFINPWHKALAFLEKSLKTVSELDLTTALHSFPQKLQYAYKCDGLGKDNPCRSGLFRDGSVCSECKGTGYKFHTSAQDALILAMPDSKDDMLDLDKLIVYKTPPTDLIRWQNEYVQQLKVEAKEAVFNASLIQKKAGGSSGGGNGGTMGSPTATEIDVNVQSIYDALEPFTEKFSELYREFVTVFALLTNEKMEDVTVVHNFPADFKLKTMDILLADLKAANDSSAPSFLIDALNMDLAEIMFNGDDLGLMKYRTKRKFFPFNGKSTEDVQFLMSLPIVAEREKILFANFEAIFTELEMENPDFYFLKEAAQSEKLEDKIQEWLLALEAGRPPAPILGPNPAGGEGSDTGGNAGSGNDNPDNTNP